jgi:hypothetical protein
MSDAVLTAQTTTPQSVLDNVTAKGLQVINAWIRDFPELMYVGLYLPNVYKDGGKMKRGGLTYAEQKQLSFKSIGSLETDMTINKNEVVWYEAGAFVEKAVITTANASADDDVVVSASQIKFFAAGDVVVVKPGIGSTTTEVQATIVSVDVPNHTIKLDTAVTCAIDDVIMFAYNLIEHRAEISRGVADGDVTPVRVYFQKFGGSFDFDSQEINQTRLFNDAQEYVKSKFSIVINRSNNNFARAFYLGRNIAGTKSETQGLDAVIAEKEARDGAGSAIIDFTGVVAGKAKAKKLVQVINKLCTAPVYTGSEVPTFYCNYEFITNLSEVMYDMGNFYTLQDKTIDFGLTEYSSPYFKNVKFIVSHTLNTLHANKSIAYAFPKHLVTFRVPEYQSVNESGALVKTQATGYSVLKMPQTSVDYVKYTAQMTIANIFGGQTFENTYAKIINF